MGNLGCEFGMGRAGRIGYFVCYRRGTVDAFDVRFGVLVSIIAGGINASVSSSSVSGGEDGTDGGVFSACCRDRNPTSCGTECLG